MRRSLFSLSTVLVFLGISIQSLAALADEGGAVPTDNPPVSESKQQARTERVIDDSNYYLGGNLGVGLIANGGGGHPDFGAIAGIHFNRDFSAGAFFSSVPRGSFDAAETNGASVGGSVNYYGLEGQYHVASIPGLQLGAKVALGTSTLDLGGLSNSTTDLYFGPKLAYDYAVSEKFTLGAEGNVLVSGADSARTTATIIAAFKFWIA